MRIVAEDRLSEIEYALSDAGYDVTIGNRELNTAGDLPTDVQSRAMESPMPVRKIVVTDDCDSITLTYCIDDGEFGGYRIYIPNLGAWRPRRNRELRAFQLRITKVLESVGAYWPFPSDVG